MHTPDPILPEWAKFTAEVERFIARHGLKDSTFGKLAVNDTAVINKMRRGVVFNLRRMARIRAFMRGYKTDNGR